MNLQLYKEELKPLAQIGNGGSWALMWDMLYSISMLKCVNHKHLVLIKSRFEKIGSKKKLQQLCDLHYLSSPSPDVFVAKKKTHALLSELEYNRDLLPVFTGNGDINELNNTEAFVKLMSDEPYFHMFLYPRFPQEKPYLKPDALMVLKDENRYKLVFLEIEASKKPNWDQYIFTKRDNYLRASKDDKVFEYWLGVAKKLGFAVPEKSEFFFSVRFIGDIKFDDWGDGFEFR